jgi:acyl-coenzyme A thioesterase PaaI-like protein
VGFREDSGVGPFASLLGVRRLSAGEGRAEAWVIARTKRIAVLEARVHGERDHPLAVATGTFYIQVSGA